MFYMKFSINKFIKLVAPYYFIISHLLFSIFRFNLRFIKPMVVEKGQRFTIRTLGNTIGTGVISDIRPNLTVEEKEDLELSKEKRAKREAQKK